MGGHQSTTSTAHTFNPEHWQLTYQNPRSPHSRSFVNKSNHRDVIEEHQVYISDEKQLQLATELQQFRVNDPQLVSANYFNIQKLDQMCSKSYSGNLYTEQMPIRLSNIVHVPFPDVLHLYNQAFNGLHRLSKVVSPFKVNQECIGVNNSHVAKVWHSPNFSQIQPLYRADSQQDMVRNVVSIIEANTDAHSMPPQEPSFSNFLFRQNDRVGFGQAKRKLELYANYFNQGVIPRYLSCVEKAGGAQNIRNQWNHSNRNQGSQSFGQFVDYNTGPVMTSSSAVNNRPLTASNQVVTTTTSVPQTGQFYQTRNTFGAETQPSGAPSSSVYVSSPPPQFTSSRVNGRFTSSQHRDVKPPYTITSRQVYYIQQPPVNIFSSRTVNHPQPALLLPTPKFAEQVKVVTQPPNLQLRTQPVPETAVFNRNVQVRQFQPQIVTNVVPVERRVNTVPTPTAVTVQQQPIRHARIVHNASEKQFSIPARTITNTQVRVEPGYQAVSQSVPARVATEPAERTIKINQFPSQNPQAPLPTQASIPNSGPATSQKQIVSTSQLVSNSNQNIVINQPTIVSQRSASQLPIPTNQVSIVQNKQVVTSSQQFFNPVSSSQLPQPVPVAANQASRTVSLSQTIPTTNANPIPTIQFAPSSAVTQSSPSPLPQKAVQSQFLQQLDNPSSLVQTPWISQTLKFQYEQNSTSPAVVKQNEKPAETQSTWINDTLNWQFKQNYQPAPVVTSTQEQWQSPVFSTSKSQQVDLNQAISASSRYRQDKLSESPERRDLDLKIQLKSPTDINGSISEIQVKQSKLMEEKAFEQPKQSSINTSTRNFYNNLGNNDSGSYSQNDWQYGNEYSTSYRTYGDDNYGNFEKKNEFASYGKSTGQFAYNEDEAQLLKKVEDIGEATASKPTYSFGGASEGLNYDYVSTYQNKGQASASKNRQEPLSSDYSGKSQNNYESNNAQYGNYQSNSYNNYETNYESSATKANGVSNYDFEYRNVTGEFTKVTTDKESNSFGYQKASQNFGVIKTEPLSYKASAGITNKFTENTDLKYSMVEDDPYNVEWDPQILADLQANVHGSRKS